MEFCNYDWFEISNWSQHFDLTFEAVHYIEDLEFDLNSKVLPMHKILHPISNPPARELRGNNPSNFTVQFLESMVDCLPVQTVDHMSRILEWINPNKNPINSKQQNNLEKNLQKISDYIFCSIEIGHNIIKFCKTESIHWFNLHPRSFMRWVPQD